MAVDFIYPAVCGCQVVATGDSYRIRTADDCDTHAIHVHGRYDNNLSSRRALIERAMAARGKDGTDAAD